jgi:hypothetical protein
MDVLFELHCPRVCNSASHSYSNRSVCICFWTAEPSSLLMSCLACHVIVVTPDRETTGTPGRQLLCHPCRLAPIPEELQFGPRRYLDVNQEDYTCTTNCIRTLWTMEGVSQAVRRGGGRAGHTHPTPMTNCEPRIAEATSRHYARFVNLVC